MTEDDELLARLRARLDPAFRYEGSVWWPPGWRPLIVEVADAIDADPDVVVVQVKEKFGGLRVYTMHASDHTRAVIAAAEQASVTVCQECGDPRRRRSYLVGGIATVCVRHWIAGSSRRVTEDAWHDLRLWWRVDRHRKLGRLRCRALRRLLRRDSRRQRR